MLPLTLLLLIAVQLPAAVLTEITIRISCDAAAGNSSLTPNPKVEFSGTDVNITSDADREIFRINDHELKDAVRIYHGARPDKAYIRNTKPDNLYTYFNWKQVNRTLTVKNAKIISVTSETNVIKSRNFKNDKSTPVTVDLKLSHSYNSEVTHFWTKPSNVTTDININYDVSIGLNGQKHFNRTNMFLRPFTDEIASKVEAVSPNVTLKPGQEVVAVLTASKGIIGVEVEYEESLEGAVIAQYNSKYQDHFYWSLAVGEVMKSGNIPMPVQWTEVVTIKFYVDEIVTVYDLNGNKVN